MDMEGNAYVKEKNLVERVKEAMKKGGTNNTKLGDQIGFSRSAVSRFLNGDYRSDELETKLEEWLRTQEPEETAKASRAGLGGKALPEKERYYQSKDYLSVMGLCRGCQEDVGLGIVVGKSGFGKTHALKKYASLPRVAYIECDDTMAPRDLILAIESSIGMPRSFGTNWERVNRIREFFNMNKGWLLIVDEADKLISKYTQKKMEILRGIFDQSDVALVVAGEPRLETEIKSNLERMGNRMDFYYKMRGLSAKEVEDYFSGYEVDADAMQELLLRATNNRTGCFRLLDRTLNNVRRILRENDGTRITMNVITQASGMMML